MRREVLELDDAARKLTLTEHDRCTRAPGVRSTQLALQRLSATIDLTGDARSAEISAEDERGSDRSIAEYCRDIWRVAPVPVDLAG